MGTVLADNTYLEASTGGLLTPRSTYRVGADFSVRASALLITGSAFSADSPYFLVGNSGTVTIPSTASNPEIPSGSKWLRMVAPYAGSLHMELQTLGIDIDYDVLNDNADLLQEDTEGDLDVVLSSGEAVMIRLYDAPTDTDPGPDPDPDPDPGEGEPGIPTSLDLSGVQFYEYQGAQSGFYDADTNRLQPTNGFVDFWSPDMELVAGDYVIHYDDESPPDIGFAAHVPGPNPFNNNSPVAGEISLEDRTVTFTVNQGFVNTRKQQGRTQIWLYSNAPVTEVIYPSAPVQLMTVGSAPTIDDGVVLTWTYAERASSRLAAFLVDDTIDTTPGLLQVNLANAYPYDVVTFSVVGPTVANDFGQVTCDEYGDVASASVDLPALQRGTYVLRCESAASGTVELPFKVLTAPLTHGEPNTNDPTPPTEQVVRWTFFDVRNPAIKWTMQRNPSGWSNLNPPNDFTHQPTTAPDGQILTWEAGSRPWRIEFTGFIDNEAEYQRFEEWTSKRRRLWLADHRGRYWLLTLENFDARHVIKVGLPWAHEYTVRALVFKREDS